jgi:hypothetical protein
MVEFILSFILHLILLGSLVAFVLAGIHVVLDTDRREERWLRVGMALCGPLVILGAQAGGLTIAEFMVNALESASPGFIAASIAAHGGLGAGLGWYLTRSMKRSNDIAVRIMAFIGTLTATEFIEMYALAVKSSGIGLGRAVIPDVSFVVGVILYVALTYNPMKKTQRAGHGSGSL